MLRMILYDISRTLAEQLTDVNCLFVECKIILSFAERFPRCTAWGAGPNHKHVYLCFCCDSFYSLFPFSRVCDCDHVHTHRTHTFNSVGNDTFGRFPNWIIHSISTRILFIRIRKKEIFIETDVVINVVRTYEYAFRLSDSCSEFKIARPIKYSVSWKLKTKLHFNR